MRSHLQNHTDSVVAALRTLWLANLWASPMRYALETIFVSSIGHIGVISGISMTNHGNPSRCAFSASKLPLFVLLKMTGQDDLAGFETSGTPIPIEKIEDICPGYTHRFSEGAKG